MLQFKCADDLRQLPEDEPAYPIIADLVERLIVDYPEGYTYDPDGDGWICLVEPHDVDRVLTEIWDDWSLLDIPWEGINREGEFFQAVFLANNEFGLIFVIPDELWVNGELREVIEENLDPPLPETTTA